MILMMPDISWIHNLCNISICYDLETALCSKCSKVLNEIPRILAPKRFIPMLNFCDITLRKGLDICIFTNQDYIKSINDNLYPS